MTLTKQWLNLYLLRLSARRWLNLNPDPIAASCLFHLNRYVHGRRDGLARRVYRAKDAIIRRFYEAGYCVDLLYQKQTLPCNSCDGLGERWNGEDCYKCDGTGVYRTYCLYQFTFDIGNRRYIWHTPDSLVDWLKPSMARGSGLYRGSFRWEQGFFDERRELIDLYYAVLVVYLQMIGGTVERPNIITLRQAIMGDLHRTRPMRAYCRWRGRWWVWRRRQWEAVRRLWYLAHDKEPDWISEDEIPF